MQLKNDFYYYLVNKNIYLNRDKNIDISMLSHTVEYIIFEINFLLSKFIFLIVSQNRTMAITPYYNYGLKYFGNRT